MKRLIVIAAILTAALLGITAATANAATVDDLRALGYTVTIKWDCAPGKHVYHIEGFGNSSDASECEASGQELIDSWANPVAFCNVKWQYDHHDQLLAFTSIVGKGWSISGDQCADVYNVTNPNDGTTAYSGSGAGLPGFDQANGPPPAAQGGASAPSGATNTGSPGACLPLCPNPGDTRGGGGILIPGGGVLVTSGTAGVQPLTASSVVAPFTDPAVAYAAATILYPDSSSGALVRAGIGSDGALTAP